ncbi:hypothetical protein ACHAQH_000915 [Verticillium albo-atrum]
MPGLLMAPESPRWLISVGHLDEAADIIAKHHAGGNRDDPLVFYQMADIETTITAEKEATSSASNLGWAVAADMNADRLGRRFLFMSSGITMLTSFIVVTGLSGAFASSASSSVGIAVIPFLFLFFTGHDMVLTPFLTTYPCEIWQFSLRSRGLTVAWCTTVASILLNTFVNAIALEAIGWRY